MHNTINIITLAVGVWPQEGLENTHEELESVRMMLNVQAQEKVMDTVIGVVTRKVAENSVVFKEASQRKLEEKQAEEARKLQELRKSLAQADVVDVAKAKVQAEEAKVAEPEPRPAVAPQPVRGTEIDIKA